MGKASDFTDNGSMSNIMLRMGEVQRIYFPTDPGSVSKKFIEYDVWVQHRANRTAVTKLYTHVIAIDALASFADFSFSTYRADPSGSQATRNHKLTPGYGAKVILLCINGETNNAVILGGIRDFHSEPDDVMDGHHHHSRFNGIDFVVNKDGELVITYQGAQKMDGTPEDGVDQDAVGTTITISKNGNVTIADVENKNQIVIDHEADMVRVESDNEVDVTAPTVKIEASTEFDVDTDTANINADSAVNISAPQVTIGESEAAEPLVKGETFDVALNAFATAFAAYLTGIQPTADTTGALTPPMLTALASFVAAASAANTLNTAAS